MSTEIPTLDRDFDTSLPARSGQAVSGESPGGQRSRSALVVAIVAAVLGAVLIGLSLHFLPGMLSKPPQEFVTASGRIEGRDVTVAPKEIQARIKTLLVDEGDKVRKGQLLAELESDQLDARFRSVQATVSTLDAQIEQASIDADYTAKSTAATVAAAESAVSSAKAHLARTKAVLANSTLDHERSLKLYQEQLIPKSTLDQSTMSYETSLADVNASEKDLAQAEANLAVAQASRYTLDMKKSLIRAIQESRRAAFAQLEEAKANLAERKIFAPADGTILSRTVEAGDVVSPGSPIFVVVDMSRLYLKVYIPEPDIPKLKLGGEAEIKVDAFPDRTFRARISKIYDQAEFTPKNVETKEERVKLVFGVELAFVSGEGVLKPGMPADCVIRWKAAGVPAPSPVSP